MMQQYMKEMEKKPFEAEAFVERLAWRVLGSMPDDKSKEMFDPQLMQETFIQAIKDLKFLQERQRKKCDKLESACGDQEVSLWQEVAQLQESNKTATNIFQLLDERINTVATKVIHIGDQLESLNTPRSRAAEAQKLMLAFNAFLSNNISPSKSNSTTSLAQSQYMCELFDMNQGNLDKAADVIQKLNLIAQELPPSENFEEAKKKISKKYSELQKCLIDEFVFAQRYGNIERMTELANILSQFKGHSQCVNAFIEASQEHAFSGSFNFSDAVTLCERCYETIKVVFSSSADQIMAKFVLSLYHLKLQEYIDKILESNQSLYLDNLMMLYTKTVQLSKELGKFYKESDDVFLNKLANKVFQRYLESYITTEVDHLRDKSSVILHKYYESKGHQRKQNPTMNFQDLRRDIQAVIGGRTNINIAQIEDFGGETFLSDEVVLSILKETECAYLRCQTLSLPQEVAANALHIFEVSSQFLVEQHLHYALELAVQAIPIPQQNSSPPVVNFFKIVKQVSSMVHLVERQFNSCLIPLTYPTKHNDCFVKKKYLLEQLEAKLYVGLDRSINAIVGWIKIYLQNEQKKTDFKPEGDVDILASHACRTVVQYLNSCMKQIKSCIDGKNGENVLEELGVRLHGIIYEHLLQFSYNSAGALCVICDVNEYRKCARETKSNLVNVLFDALNSLCNLLLVKPENIKQVCNGEQLAGLDQSIVINFIQLRHDYKTQKLANILKSS
nr:PREDICTED: exocyst complex component 5 [Bemisia tabaci]